MDYRWSYGTLLLYITIAFIIAFLFKKSIIAKKKKNKFLGYSFYYLAIYIILILFSCFRTIENGTIGGTDAGTYIKWFENAQMPVFNFINTITFEGNEFLYMYLQYIVRTFTSDYHVLFFIIYSIIIISYIYFVHKEVYDENEWIILMLLILPLLTSFNLMRNCLAASVSIFALIFLKQNKDIKFIATAICAFLIHYTSAILFLFYLYHKLISNNLLKNKRLYIVLLAVFFIASTILVPIISKIFLNTGYAGYMGGEVSLLGYIPNLFLIVAVYVFYKDIYVELKKQNQLIYLSAFSFWYLLLVLLIFLGGSSRIRLFFEYSVIFLWVKVVKIMKEKVKYNGKNLTKTIQILSFIVVLMWITFKIYQMGDSSGIMPYYMDLF